MEFRSYIKDLYLVGVLGVGAFIGCSNVCEKENSYERKTIPRDIGIVWFDTEEPDYMFVRRKALERSSVNKYVTYLNDERSMVFGELRMHNGEITKLIDIDRLEEYSERFEEGIRNFFSPNLINGNNRLDIKKIRKERDGKLYESLKR